MGYTHYWKRPVEIDRQRFSAIVSDFRKLLEPLRESGVVLADGYGGDKGPTVHPDGIWFNGAQQCGHKQKKAAAAKLLQAALAGRTAAFDDYLHLDGRDAWLYDWRERRCPGDCSFETFDFPRFAWNPLSPDKADWRSCKTNRRHYDLAVTACLIIAKQHLKGDLTLTGYEELWFEARLLCQQELGFGLDLVLFDKEHSR